MMNKSRTKRLGALVAASTVAFLGLAGCTAPGGGGDGDVTITWWHNATNDPLMGIWEDVAAEFEDAHPGVTVEVTGYQSEDLQRTIHAHPTLSEALHEAALAADKRAIDNINK